MTNYFTGFGTVVKASGFTIHVTGLVLAVGDICKVDSGKTQVYAEVIGFEGERAVLMVYETINTISIKSIIYKVNEYTSYTYSDSYLGAVVDAFGQTDALVSTKVNLPDAYEELKVRKSVSLPLDVGVSAINGFLTLGVGQRIGVMAGSGVGKSVLLSMITKNTSADICVCALIGERSREVVDFVEKTLSGYAKEKSVVVSSPADTSPLKKIRATEYAIRIAERYASQGKNVVLLFDSLTRYAHALREVGLSAGEPPTMKGYPPSVFLKIPQLVERCGNFKKGSITGVFTVLMDGDDENDPVVDSARAILDGHVVLSRDLASSGHFPAIDIGRSISRCMGDIVSLDHQEKANYVRGLMSSHKKNSDLVAMGAYQPGSDEELDTAIKKWPAILNCLKQKPFEVRDFNLTEQMMRVL